MGRPKNDGTLTPREREVYELLGQGQRLTDIAQELWITSSTVQEHVQAIKRKTGCKTLFQIAVKAAQGEPA